MKSCLDRSTEYIKLIYVINDLALLNKKQCYNATTQQQQQYTHTLKQNKRNQSKTTTTTNKQQKKNVDKNKPLLKELDVVGFLYSRTFSTRRGLIMGSSHDPERDNLPVCNFRTVYAKHSFSSLESIPERFLLDQCTLYLGSQPPSQYRCPAQYRTQQPNISDTLITDW